MHQWGPTFHKVGQYAHTIFGSSDDDDKQQQQQMKKEMGGHYAATAEYKYNTAERYGPPSYPRQQRRPTGWEWDDDGAYKYPPRKPPAAAYDAGWDDDDGAYNYPPRKPPPSYGGGGRYPPQPQPREWDDDGAYNYPPRKPPGAGYGGGGHPPRRPMDWDDGGGAQEYPPQQEVNKKPECKPPGQEPPSAKKEPEDMPSSQPKASPKHESNKPPAASDPPPKLPYGGHPRPDWDGYPPQYGEGGDYCSGRGGGGGYPSARERGYQAGGGQRGGYGNYDGGYYRGGWPRPAPPAGARASYGAYHQFHKQPGYGGSGGYDYDGSGGYGGEYTHGHQGKFKHYAHHHGKF